MRKMVELSRMLWICQMKWIFVGILVTFVLNDPVSGLIAISLVGGGAIKAGGPAKLRCEYDLEGAPLYSIRWYREEVEFYRYVPKESPPTMVFPVSGVHVDLSASNDQQVTLKDVDRHLAGIYQCEVSGDAPLFHTEIMSTTLTVIDVPDRGPLLTVDRVSYSAGDSVRANCSSHMSYPSANITWYLNGEKLNKTHTTTFPLQPDSWESSFSFSVIEISTEERIHHPRYQVGGTQQEISSSQLKIPSQDPEITVYTAYSPVLNAHWGSFEDTRINGEKKQEIWKDSNDGEVNGRREYETKLDEAWQNERKPEYDSQNEARREEDLQKNEDNGYRKKYDFGIREYPLKLQTVPLKVTRVKMQPGFAGAVTLKCEASIYDVYKAGSNIIKIREETPLIALVMGQSSAGGCLRCLEEQWFSIVGLSWLHTVWKVLLSTR